MRVSVFSIYFHLLLILSVNCGISQAFTVRCSRGTVVDNCCLSSLSNNKILAYMTQRDELTDISPTTTAATAGPIAASIAASKVPFIEPIVKNSNAVLFLVPIIWGLYTPIIKGLYTFVKEPPPPLLFNLLSYSTSFTALSIARSIGMNRNTDISSNSSSSSSSSSSRGDNNSILDASATEMLGGLELGMYIFIGSTLQIYGIQQTSATKSAFLVQLTTIIVPILESLMSKKRVPNTTYIACVLAFIGVVFVSDLNISDLSLVGSMGQGDAYVCLSALFYSMHVVRLSSYASTCEPLNIARVKNLTEATIAFFVILFVGSNYGEVVTYLTSVIKGTDTSVISNNTNIIYVLLAVLWNGLFSTALCNWAQTKGQVNASASAANLIYSSQPIWGSLIALLLLHDDSITHARFLLGSTLLMSGIVVGATASKDNEKR